MAVFSSLSAGLVSGLHVYILVLEMYLWNTPRGRKAFRMTPEYAAQTAKLAANQGLYNGFLAAGLAWSLAHPVPEFAQQIRLFFLGCVGVAGLYGGATVNRRIWYIQTVPAVLSAGITLLGL